MLMPRVWHWDLILLRILGFLFLCLGELKRFETMPSQQVFKDFQRLLLFGACEYQVGTVDGTDVTQSTANHLFVFGFHLLGKHVVF